MDNLRIKTKFILNAFVDGYRESVDHEMMEKFGFYPDTEKYTGFYVRKEPDTRKSKIFIDLYGVYTIPGGILYNVIKDNDAGNDDLYLEVQDMIEAGLVTKLIFPVNKVEGVEPGDPVGFMSHWIK